MTQSKTGNSVVAICDSHSGAEFAIKALQRGGPKESVVKYELEVKAGKFLILGHGNADLVERARGILGTTGASQLTAHSA